MFEALLHAGRTLQTAGSVDRGTSISDFDPLEKALGHSINSSIASIDHAGIHINLVDTPGYPGFRGPTLSALALVETCAVLGNAGSRIEHGTIRLMDYARARRLCQVVVTNRIDTEGCDLLQLGAHRYRSARPARHCRDAEAGHRAVASRRSGPMLPDRAQQRSSTRL